MSAAANTASRESHEVRKRENARHALDGLAKCSTDEASPARMSASASAMPVVNAGLGSMSSGHTSTSASSDSRPSPAPDITVKNMMLSVGFIAARCALAANDRIREACEPAFEQRARIVEAHKRFRLARRQIAIDRFITQLGEQAKAAARRRQARHFRIRIVEVAEEARMRRTCEHARRLALFGRQQLVVDPVDAQRALFHGARGLVEL